MNKELEANTNLSHYRIVQNGAGGMGAASLFQNLNFDRKVALKILRSKLK